MILLQANVTVVSVFDYEIHLMKCSARKKGNEEERDEVDQEDMKENEEEEHGGDLDLISRANG